MSDIDKLTPGQKLTPADKLVVAIGESITGHRGRVTNRSYKWPKLCEQLSTPVRDNITTAQFHRLPETEQHKRKNRGYIVGGTFEKGIRKEAALENRSVLTFDIDRPSLAIAEDLLTGKGGWLADVEYFAYTTRSHTPEAPRLRVFIPLTESVHKDRLAPLSRIIAYRIDPEMETVDPVSFRAAQIMYLPSVNKDAEFRKHRNLGRLLEPEPILEQWGAWDNYNSLPKSPREGYLRKHGTTVQDPRTKRGIVGAFCRIYDVHTVIAKYLSDTYEPGEAAADGNERYSYLKGSATTKNGAIVYEDGIFLYSHHGTDPAGGRLSHSYELFRIHFFGYLDKPEDLEEAENDPRSLPSYKASIAWLTENDPAVAAEYTRSLYDLEAMADDASFELDEDDTADAAEPEPPPKPAAKAKTPATATEPAERSWLEDLDRNEKGGIKNTLHNVQLILTNDARFKGALAYNEFTNEAVIIRRIRSKQYKHDTGPIRSKANGDMIGSHVLTTLRVILEGPRGDNKTGWGLRVSDRDLEGAVEDVARRNSFHPVRDYLYRCEWDGVCRVRKMLHTYWHTLDTLYHEEVGFLFMVGAVARIMEPGCKFDFVLILEGLTGIRKTTSFAIIAGWAWAGEFTADPHRTDKVIENLAGKWMLEIPELTAFGRSDSEVLKALFSARTDRARLAWGRGAKDYPRQCVFYGTTNNAEYFRDMTGNRRYWPVKIPDGQTIDTDALARDRDVIWAEAREWYLWFRRQHPEGNLPLYLKGEAAKIAVTEQSERMITDDSAIMRGRIVAWLDQPVPEGQHEPGWVPDMEWMGPDEDDPTVLRRQVCIADVLRYALNVTWQPGRNGNGRLATDVAKVMQTITGWRKLGIKWTRCGMGPQLLWERVETNAEDL